MNEQTAEVEQRKSWLDEQIQSKDRDLEMLRTERADLDRQWPAAVRELAVRLHSIRCAYDHTEGCAWYYDNDKAFEIARGRKEYAARIERALALGLDATELGALLDQLPAPAEDLPGPWQRTPPLRECLLADAMTRAFTRHFEGEMRGSGPGWSHEQSGWRLHRRWSDEQKAAEPWNGEQHRRMIAAARAWQRTSGLELQRLTEIAEALARLR